MTVVKFNDKRKMMSVRYYTTEEAAKKAGITRATLQAWIKARKIRPPKPTFKGAVGKRLWTEPDLGRLRKKKEEIYWKGQGRPHKKK